MAGAGRGTAPGGPGGNHLVITNAFAQPSADLADRGVPVSVDGRSFAPLLEQDPPAGSDWRTAILNEQDQKQRFHIPDYEAVRTDNQTYVRWKTGEREVYDLRDAHHALGK